MPYATHADVAAEFKGLTALSATTTPTATQVTDFIARASNLIDSKIAGKYATPVSSTTAPRAYSVLQEICIGLVRHKVAGILSLPTADTRTTSGGSKLNSEEKALTSLTEIQTGKMKLVDAELATAADGVQGQGNNDSASLQPPTFRKEGDQW